MNLSQSREKELTRLDYWPKIDFKYVHEPNSAVIEYMKADADPDTHESKRFLFFFRRHLYRLLIKDESFYSLGPHRLARLEKVVTVGLLSFRFVL
jgi:hypothetical protein